MDYKEYKQLYDQLLSQKGREELGNDTQQREKLEAKINDFLEKYPKVIPKDKDPQTPFHLLSLKEVFHRTILTAIDVIHDISDILSQKESLTATEVRRRIFKAFTKRERRVYIGIWLVMLAFVLFFIDGSGSSKDS
jgi:hypothetical protein